ncbi:integral membrane protein [Apiospora rasikravindrae]|uniref:Integral membrane protein n=1 Tax=Apiospora rasikravindrae TaxID=990691 RepID=A0ABR1RY57_9PEZI
MYRHLARHRQMPPDEHQDILRLFLYEPRPALGRGCESRVRQVKVTSSVAIALTFPIVIARLVARYTISGKLFGDDIVIVLASYPRKLTTRKRNQILAISADALILATGFLGFGLHLWDVDPAHAPALLQLVYAGQIVYSLVKTLAKVAILCLIRQVFARVTWIQRVVKGGFVFYFCSGVAFTTVVTLQCLPVQANWIPSLRPSSRCLDIQAVGYAAGALTIAEDIFMIILPLPHLFRLQMSIKKKMSVSLLFGFAFFATITSIIRLKYLVEYGTSVDLTWTNVETGMWSMIEVHSNIIFASFPALWRWFWNLSGAIWKMCVNRDARANSSKLVKRVTQHASRKDRNLKYYPLHSPEENRMMHEMLFTPIPPLAHTRSDAEVGPRGNRNFDCVEEVEDFYRYNVFAWKPPYQKARGNW